MDVSLIVIETAQEIAAVAKMIDGGLEGPPKKCSKINNINTYDCIY